MSNLSIEDILIEIKRICLKYQVEQLYLFGSYATNTASDTSDIDIIVKGGVNFMDMQEEINNIPTLKKIDIFDYDRCANQYLREDMIKYGRKIY